MGGHWEISFQGYDEDEGVPDHGFPRAHGYKAAIVDFAKGSRIRVARNVLEGSKRSGVSQRRALELIV